jgi:hypothetical protein
MDEYEDSGLDDETRRYFSRIISSFFTGLFWMLVMSMLAFYFGLAVPDGRLRWYNILFYVLFLLSLAWLIRYFYRKWKR